LGGQPVPRTRSGLLTEARHVVPPLGMVGSSFPSVEATCRELGLTFDPWQADLNRLILAKDAAGLYAADTVAMSIPRQAGKTWDVGALVFADSIIHPKTTTVWTAHRFPVARETFNELRAVAMTPKLAHHIDVDEITTGSGNEMIPFRNGSRILFKARERGAIRGFSKVRRLILDEAQILQERALSDLAPTQNQAWNPQIILMGTPPKVEDPSEVFTRLREEALTGEAEGLLYVEFAADPGSDPDDREAWLKANPSFPGRTNERAMRRLRRILSGDDWAREGLGIWSDLTAAAAFGVGNWEACAGVRPDGLTIGGLAVAVSYDLSKSAIGAAGVSDDGLAYGKPLQHGPGTDWVVGRALELQQQHGVEVVIDGRGPAADLIDPLKDAGVRLKVADTVDVLDAYSGIQKAVRNRRFVHESFVELDAAARSAVPRTVGDRHAWGRKQSDSDISPLEAVTLAVWAASRGRKPSAYADQGVRTV
jgi:hypothetical protein